MARTHPLPSSLQSMDAILLVSPHLRSLMKSSRVNLSSRLLSAPTSYQGYVSTQLSCLNFGPLQNLKAATVIDVRIGARKFQLHHRCSMLSLLVCVCVLFWYGPSSPWYPVSQSSSACRSLHASLAHVNRQPEPRCWPSFDCSSTVPATCFT